MMDKIILASTSPRRKALLEQINIPFTVVKNIIDEKIEDEVSPYDLVKILSARKAMSVVERLRDCLDISDLQDIDSSDRTIVIAADTVVYFKGLILGKPKTDQEAFNMLKKLQNNHHSVYTGMTIAIKKADNIELKYIVDNTIVFMRKLSDNEIWTYIKTGEPFDKAGAYAIQNNGALLIEKIEGDYYTIVGLPLVKLYQALKESGVDITENWNR